MMVPYRLGARAAGDTVAMRITWGLGAGAAVLLGAVLWTVLPGRQPVHQVAARAAPPLENDNAEPDRARLLYATMTWTSYRHPTSGIVEIYRLPGGRRLLRLADLASAHGLRVLLSPDGRTGTDLGGARRGAANYPIPAATDLTRISGVVLWDPRSNAPVATAPVRVTAAE
jgi:hypothetical protein